MKVTANESFCSCLGEQLPMIVTFITYSQIVIDPQNIKFAGSLTANERQVLLDKTMEAREICVTK